MGKEQAERFRRIRLLDGGGIGVVHLAFDEQLERNVVLKEIRADLLESPAACARFQSECRALSRLSHPNIAGLLSVLDGSPPCLVLEHVAGDNLAEILDRHRRLGSLPGIGECLGWAEDVARALQHVHGHGLVHRDVKPQNIVIGPAGNAVLIDFGFVRDERSDDLVLTRTGQALGTSAYMAPERIRNDGKPVDGQADVFALGVVLFEILCGQSPFARATAHETEESICQDVLPHLRGLRRDIPRDVQAVAETALARPRAHRYPDALAFARDLAACRRSEPPVLVHRSLASRLGDGLRRYLAVAAGLTLSLALVVAVAGARTLAHETERDRIVKANDNKFYRAMVQAQDLIAAAAGIGARPEDAERAISWLAEADDLLRRRWWNRAATDPEHATRWASWIPVLKQRLEELDDHRRAVAERRQCGDRDRSVVVDRAAEWAAAIAAIRGRPEYRGLELPPQHGLAPLGEDPVSRLQEFAHLSSGEPARRDPVSGRLSIAAGTGLVLVLLPGGNTVLGAQPHDPSGPNHDAFARDSEGPPFAVELKPFFLSKYEMTRAQWARLSCAGPDFAGPSANQVLSDLDHPNDPDSVPVDNVSWLECSQLLALYGLELPTENEWEYACRASTATRWWTGDDPEQYRLTHPLVTQVVAVDRGVANPFGLFHVHDGVREWCRDLYRDYSGSTVRSAHDTATTMRSVRPALWNYDRTTQDGVQLDARQNGSRSSARDKQPESVYQFDLGLRPLRRIR